MLLSAIAWFSSLVIFAYGVIAIVNEGSVEIYPRRVSPDLIASRTAY